MPKNPLVYHCEICDFKCFKKSNYNNHILTLKHKNLTNPNKKNAEKIEYHNCICGKKYKHLSTLCSHRKKCTLFEKINNQKNIIIEEKINNSENLILLFMKQNQEFQKQLLEIMKENIGIHTTNNTTHNKFNMNLFLNEKCKDAPNLIDFINSIQLKLSDFENFGTFGYADNISRILLREIKDVDIYKRPIHCSDLKREVIHVKDDNAWKKDEDKMHMKKAIKEIAYKNFKTIIPEWVKENPDSKDITTKKHDKYIKMMSNSMGEVTEEGDEKNYNKIIRTVAKEILVEKDK